MVLRERGWDWQLMPHKVAVRAGLAHQTCNSVGAFYTLGKTILPAYAQCLLRCQELHDLYSLDYIPHSVKRPRKDYQLILEGKPIPQQERQAKKAQQSLQYEFEDQVPLQIEDGHVHADDDEQQNVDLWLEEVLDMEANALEEQAGLEEENSGA